MLVKVLGEAGIGKLLFHDGDANISDDVLQHLKVILKSYMINDAISCEGFNDFQSLSINKYTPLFYKILKADPEKYKKL